METRSNLIIVYSSKDENANSKLGWVFSFHRFLELLLAKLLRKKIKIDLVEVSNLNFDKIYTTSTILITIASEPLFNSNIFKEEVKKFHEKSIHKEKNNLSWSSRIFKIFKKPIKGHFLLDFLSNSLGYNFYHKDPLTNEIVKYNDFTSPDSQKTFWMRLYDLAYDISKLLQDLESSKSEIDKIKEQISKEYIYLSAVGSDLENERSIIRRELQRSGFSVLPEQNIPDDIDSAIKMVRNDLTKCCMAIHLIGADPGKIKGSNASILELQLRIATELIVNEEKMDEETSYLSLGRVIWVSPSMDKISVKQRIFIENLKKDTNTIRRADLLESNIEELKGFISNKIINYRSEKIEEKKTRSKKKVIYLICNSSEYEKCKPVEKYLNSHGFEVISSLFQGTPNEVRNEHIKNLKRCDATLVYYGGTNENWIKSKLQDLSKSLGINPDEPIGPQAVIIDSEEKFDEVINTRKNTMVLYKKGRMTNKTLEPFLAQLES